MQTKLGWQYYNHAVIPTTAPHEAANENALKQKDFWKSFKGEGFPLLARWTTDFDCPEPTDWWYVVKDTPYDLMSVTSKYRNKVKRGLKAFDLRIIEPMEYAETLYQVAEEALSQYPRKYRPKLDHDRFVAQLGKRKENNCLTFCAFCKEEDCIAGYMCVIVHDGYIMLFDQKARPSQEKKQLNAAMVYSVLDHFQQKLAQGVYIVDGERSILHETSFQDYLEKYFGFRKAYCRLHIQYRKGIALLVSCLYPMRNLIKRLSDYRLFCHINSVMKMEKIIRGQEDSCTVDTPKAQAQ